MPHIIYLSVVVLLVLGFYGVLFRRNLIKITIAVNIMEAGVNLLLIGLGYRSGGMAPIFTQAWGSDPLTMALPTPQALILTNIVIGFATTALMITLAVLTARHNGTVETGRLRGIEHHE